jgi:hypothetical protein
MKTELKYNNAAIDETGLKCGKLLQIPMLMAVHLACGMSLII